MVYMMSCSLSGVECSWLSLGHCWFCAPNSLFMNSWNRLEYAAGLVTEMDVLFRYSIALPWCSMRLRMLYACRKSIMPK
jgi:hypothetical protein